MLKTCKKALVRDYENALSGLDVFKISGTDSVFLRVAITLNTDLFVRINFQAAYAFT